MLREIVCDCPRTIPVRGTLFVTTGEFLHDRLRLEHAIRSHGGILKGYVSRHTQFVIVGGRGPSLAWKYFNYGTKLAHAVNLQSKGFDVRIVLERDFLQAARVTPTSPAPVSAAKVYSRQSWLNGASAPTLALAIASGRQDLAC